jgi:hypothetical protein
MMATGARTVLLSRWRTGGRTNLDLVREYARELPEGPAAAAWQRACLLARESPLDSQNEPRLKGLEDASEPPAASHPFFWAGYLLVDTSPRPEEKDSADEVQKQAGMNPDENDQKKGVPPNTQDETATDQPKDRDDTAPGDSRAGSPERLEATLK